VTSHSALSHPRAGPWLSAVIGALPPTACDVSIGLAPQRSHAPARPASCTARPASARGAHPRLHARSDLGDHHAQQWGGTPTARACCHDAPPPSPPAAPAPPTWWRAPSAPPARLPARPPTLRERRVASLPSSTAVQRVASSPHRHCSAAGRRSVLRRGTTGVLHQTGRPASGVHAPLAARVQPLLRRNEVPQPSRAPLPAAVPTPSQPVHSDGSLPRSTGLAGHAACRRRASEGGGGG
jgi:hypothetical protein